LDEVFIAVYLTYTGNFSVVAMNASAGSTPVQLAVIGIKTVTNRVTDCQQ